MPVPSLRTIVSAIALALTLGAAASTVHAIGSAADINVVDRNTGQMLPVYTHQGRHYVAGRPGARYAVRVYNRTRGPEKAIIAPGSAMCTSPSIAYEADTPPEVGSVRTTT